MAKVIVKAKPKAKPMVRAKVKVEVNAKNANQGEQSEIKNHSESSRNAKKDRFKRRLRPVCRD